MQSVFMGRSASLWIMQNLEHTMIGVNLKQFSHSGKVILLTLYNGGPTRLGNTYQ